MLTLNKFKLMLIIDIKNSDSLERALKILKRKVIDTKQLQNLRDRKEFEKPSVKRRSEINKAKYIQKKRDVNNK
jgi:small subunit ribosomal protein S21